MSDQPIYVETHINTSVEEVWEHTQSPEVHQRWDVRFTNLDAIHGRGETLGERHRDDGTAYSGLKFWSDNPLSLIKDGAGYWRYVPTPTGVRFLTRYDYKVRWGILGRTLDRLVFRALFGWATAWSSDRLRLWIERGIEPERSRNQTLAQLISVLMIGFAWIYHGLIPKLLYSGSGELDLLIASGAGFGHARLILGLIGIGEIVFGIALLRWWRHRWPFLVTLVAMPVLSLCALASDSSAFVRPFNPITLNLGVMALASIALLTRDDLPSGRLPLRQAPHEPNTVKAHE